jgi:hypothetical protein
MFTNLIIAMVLSTNSLVAHDNSYPKQETNAFKLSSQVALINNYYLIYTDIFTCTKTYYNKSFDSATNYNSDGTYSYIHYSNSEANPVADIFWRDNAWEIGYASAVILNTVVVNYLNNIDNTGILGFTYTTILSIAELQAIFAWSYNSDFKINIKSQILTITF